MCNYKFSTRVTLYSTRAVLAIVLALLLCFPTLVQHYHDRFRPLLDTERTAVLAGFYLCSLAILPALWNMDRLLRNILQEQLFTGENVRCIRTVRWCCLAVSLICLGAAFGFPSLLFLSLIMAFLFLVVTVVGQVLKTAVAIREENDLTV